MKNALAAMLIACGLPSALFGAEPARGTHADPAYGFSMAIPSLGLRGDVPTVPRLVVAGPARDGFSPNCNVQVQFVDLGLKGFMDLTTQQFAAAGVRLLGRQDRKVSNLDAAAFEYAASLNDRELRFMALAVAAKDRVWLVTCTSLAATFASHRDDFRLVIDSFAVTSPPKN